MADVIAFTDGGCRGNPGIGAWAFVLVDARSRSALERAAAVPNTTNNRMEMQAAIEALRAIKNQRSSVLVVSDSKYLIGCCTEWMAGWKAKGWKRKGDPLKNLDLLQELDQLIGARPVSFRWVMGHSGHAGNERVDRLGNEAMDRLQSGRDSLHERRFSWDGPLA